MSFSIEGADNLARVIAMVGSYDYEGISKAFEIQVFPQKAKDEAEEYIKNIEKNIREQNKKRRKVSNIKYNDSLIKLELNTDYSAFGEIEYELDKPEGSKSTFSQFLQEYVSDEEEAEMELPDGE